ncbi:hypothetical protein C8Q74DRAFT_1277627 [Fomes fomentarius]|nr:hypothetical protein C8Q74DRAFT_1277627 [Fomes fomentarius]
MSTNDDVLPEKYQYLWTPKSEQTLQEFLGKYKPSMVQNDGNKPWLWVAKDAERPSVDKGVEAATKEATDYLSEVTERVQKIQTDDSIPIRANKKKGLKSKKELREEVQQEATGKLKQIAVKHGYVSGKWLVFAPPDKVDFIWSSIANSLVSGPLSSTSAFLAKVATSPQNDTPNYSHLICIYVPDVYDQAGVTEVMKVLLRNHGLNLMGVKTNLYTSIGIDSKHASGISSTVWKNTALLKDAEIKQLKDEYFTELNSAKSAAVEETKATSSVTTKAKPKLKKKSREDDPFASDDEGGMEDDVKTAEKKAEKPAAPAKAKKPVPKKKTEVDAFGSDEEEDEAGGEKARKAEVKAKKGGAVKKRKVEESEDESEDEAPKKKRGRGRA